MDNRLVRKDDVVGERLLESTLGRTDGLRARSECSRESIGCCDVFCAREEAVRGCWVRHGGRSDGIHGQCSAGTEQVGEVETNEKASL